MHQNFRWNKEDEFPKGSFTATAYTRLAFSVEEDISGLNKIEDKQYYFTCPLPTLNEDYGYNYIALMEYDGVEHCFSVGYNKEGQFVIVSKDADFDVSKANITKVDAFSYEIYRTNYAGFALGGALYIFLFYYLPVIVIAAIIVITIIIVTRVRKKRRLNNK